jgi:VanZ family protein
MPKHNRQTVWLWSTLVGYWLALFIATHLPADFVQLPESISDKVPHFVAYALLAILATAAWQWNRCQFGWRRCLIMWLVLASYGVVDEWTQIPLGRQASVADWLFDVAGSGVGLAMFVGIRRHFRGRRTSIPNA